MYVLYIDEVFFAFLNIVLNIFNFYELLNIIHLKWGLCPFKAWYFIIVVESGLNCLFLNI